MIVVSARDSSSSARVDASSATADSPSKRREAEAETVKIEAAPACKRAAAAGRGWSSAAGRILGLAGSAGLASLDDLGLLQWSSTTE
ncbi:hypothetical protein E4U21_006974 [Claviceps maximensis]|nr:hypothetical protein E4U21_006974 [Claviceps maximensis]